MAAHSVLAAGFIGKLQNLAQTRVTASGLPNVRVAFITEPAYERVAILSGAASADEKERLLAAVKAIPGVKDARWMRDPVTAYPVDTAPTVSEVASPASTIATVLEGRDCQDKVDSAIAGRTLHFDLSRSTLKPESDALISSVADALGQCQGAVIEVQGHTDLTGNHAANQRLSEARANAVIAALVAKGVPKDRLTAAGFGETQPKIAGITEDANAANRRIEFDLNMSPSAESRTQ
jgi:OOP family OmpA-OmpF porin